MSLLVYLHETPVGLLTDVSGDRMRFQYNPEWLQDPDATPLSRSLPLQVDPFDENRTRPFFAGILPEESPRTRIASILGISESNDFALLERIGGECAGAVSLLPESLSRPQPETLAMSYLDQEELAKIVMELPKRPLLAGEDGLRLSLAGAQNKLPVVYDGDRIGLPLGSTPSTHILKPEPIQFPGLAANEAFCMRLAKSIGLPVPEVTLHHFGETRVLIVERYDRVTDDSSVKRIHQEDFCQALGRPPSRKYQQEGGPSLPECVELLRGWSSVPVLDIRNFLDGLIFTIAIGNADAHGKNYSFLYADGQRRLAPLYDLVCTLAWPELSSRAAMSIGSGKMMNEITLDHWKKMAAQCQLGWPMVRERIAQIHERVLKATEDPGPGTSPDLIRLIRNRCSG